MLYTGVTIRGLGGFEGFIEYGLNPDKMIWREYTKITRPTEKDAFNDAADLLMDTKKTNKLLANKIIKLVE